MTRPSPTALGRRLTLVRDRADLSLRGFAHELRERADYGISHSTVREYEVGGSAPADYVRAVCLAFGVEPAWLLDVTDGNDGTAPTDTLVEDALQGIGTILRELVDRIAEDGGSGAPARTVEDAGRAGDDGDRRGGA